MSCEITGKVGFPAIPSSDKHKELIYSCDSVNLVTTSKLNLSILITKPGYVWLSIN